MAKVGFWLQGSTGKLAGSALQKGVNGTVIREIVKPKNPKTNNQILQRVLMNTVSQGYSALKDICSHAFQGITEGAPSMARFQKANLGYFRERASEISEDQLSAFVNFVPVGQKGIRPARFIVSEGTLPRVPMSITPSSYNAKLVFAENTYASVIDTFGLQRGDQLTFVAIEESSVVEGEYIAKYARIILDPRDANGNAAPLSSEFITENAINLPNSKNAGNFGLLTFDGGMEFTMKAGAKVCAVGCIVSRLDGEEWKRSNCQLVVSEGAIGEYGVSLTRAIRISKEGNPVYMSDANAYLNNAGTGGTQSTDSGSGSSQEGTSTTPEILGLSVNRTVVQLAAGSTSIVGPVTTMNIGGHNLETNSVIVEVDGEEAGTKRVNAAKADITWEGNAPVGSTVVIRKNFGDNKDSIMEIEVVAKSGGSGGYGDEP